MINLPLNSEMQEIPGSEFQKQNLVSESEKNTKLFYEIKFYLFERVKHLKKITAFYLVRYLSGKNIQIFFNT
jgi:hypothetical protein